MQGKRKFYFLALSILLLLLIFRAPAITQQTQMASQSLMRPFLITSHHLSAKTADFFNYFGIFWKTFVTHQHNQQKIDKLEAELNLYQETLKENQRLRRLLDFRENIEGETIAARVIGWDLNIWQKRIILDKGSKHGIAKNMAVVSPKGLVGRVLEVSPDTARGILINDPEGRVSAWTADTRTHGIAAGDGSPTLKLKYLDLTAEIEEGETVFSSGLTDLYPKGLHIGTVASVKKDRSGLHWVAEVIPFETYAKLEEVLCIASSPKG